MEMLVLVPIINILLVVIIAAVYSAINGTSPKGSTNIRVTPDDLPKPVDTIPQQREYPDIADQLDGRLTNVFKDPMKGIL
jgi:hypothetical protein